MIVLDEQLLGHGIEETIFHWYPGAVCFVTELRPGTVIKDEAISHLLQKAKQPTFITINETDFWRKIAITSAYCIICFALPASRIQEIPPLLQRLVAPH